MVDFELLKSCLRYLSEIFTICLSHVCANLMKKFLLLLNRPARNGPFLPKFWTGLATVIVGIFFRQKFCEVLDQYQLPIRRNFEYLEKNGVFKFFKSLHLQVFRASCLTLANYDVAQRQNFGPLNAIMLTVKELKNWFQCQCCWCRWHEKIQLI